MVSYNTDKPIQQPLVRVVSTSRWHCLDGTAKAGTQENDRAPSAVYVKPSPRLPPKWLATIKCAGVH